uniref:Cytosolic fatty-acid binding proteins domain-containing protein n=1 Tax=Ditylenchus dipsaci TaxID=166011 RepID=A0A915DV86_9BILA
MSFSDFVGKWNLLESDNFDNYMKQIGVGLLKRKMAATLKPMLEITSDGTHWKVASISTFKNHVTEFDIDKEFDEETIDGRKMKTTFKLDAGKLIQEQKKIDPNDKDSTITRYVEGDKLIIEMESEGVKAKRIYSKTNSQNSTVKPDAGSFDFKPRKYQSRRTCSNQNASQKQLIKLGQHYKRRTTVWLYTPGYHRSPTTIALPN